MLRYTLISIQMCNFAISNAVAVITLLTSIIVSLIVVCPKKLLKYEIIVNGYIYTFSIYSFIGSCMSFWEYARLQMELLQSLGQASVFRIYRRFWIFHTVLHPFLL